MWKTIDPKSIRLKTLPENFQWRIETQDIRADSYPYAFYKTEFRAYLSYRALRAWTYQTDMPYCKDNPDPDYCQQQSLEVITLCVEDCIRQAMHDQEWQVPIILAYYGATLHAARIYFDQAELDLCEIMYNELFEFKRKYSKWSS